MDTLPICSTSTAASNSSTLKYCPTSFLNYRNFRNVKFRMKQRKVSVFASKDDTPSNPLPKLDEWDRMELKFGKLLGEDPKLTLAKIMARKVDPDVSYMEVEKSFAKNKGKYLFNDLEEVDLDVLDGKKKMDSPTGLNLVRPDVVEVEGKKKMDLPSGLNLVRPIPKKGVKFETREKSVERDDIKKPTKVKTGDDIPSNMPNVMLRKPSVFNEVDDGKSLPISFKPKLSWEMEKVQQKEWNNDFTLLERPKPQKVHSDNDGENDSSSERTSDDRVKGSEQEMNSATLLGRPDPMNLDLTSRSSNTSSGCNSSSSELDSVAENSLVDIEPTTGLQPSDVGSFGNSVAAYNAPSSTELRKSDHEISTDASLLGKPNRFDQSVKPPRIPAEEEPVPVIPQSHGSAFEENLPAFPIEEHEENDWTRAEDLAKSGGRAEVEVISSNTRGFAVSFGSLIGFLPYRNLAARWRFLAFESWLRKKGLDPSKYKQNLGVIGSFGIPLNTSSFSDSTLDSTVNVTVGGEISPDMKIEDLLRIYDQEKLKFLSSFVGQKIRVAVVLVDRSSRRLIFSTKPKEKEDLIEKKKNVMGKLNVGDVVKCCITKITYFGVFIEVEGVPALIHQSEVSWDATLDPASYFKVGQVIDAKVHQLDFSLGRIFLSLKEIMPDPLLETLEAVVGDQDSLSGRLEAAQAEEEWTDVESLIEELQKVMGIQSVSKGRYFLSPGLAPTFQVYMASTSGNQYKLLARSENKAQEVNVSEKVYMASTSGNQYKLLARSENKAQEVIVESTLTKEDMKSAILTCTNRVQ